MITLPAQDLPDGFDQQQHVGGGAMGSVYRAVDADGHAWALKMLDTSAMTDADAAEAVALFEREARVLSLLADPCFPLLADFFEGRGRRWLQMEYLQGRTLERIVEANGPCPASYVLPIACELARGLSVLHELPGGAVIFRDLKPGNVMITDEGDVKMVDFGIARFHKPGAARDTQPLGTPGFAAPEQYGAAQSDARSDLYALGATLFFALTGRDPGPASDTPPSARASAPDCPAALDDLIGQCLQYDRERRPTCARSVLLGLENLEESTRLAGMVPRRRATSVTRRRLLTGFGQGSGLRGWLVVVVVALVLASGVPRSVHWHLWNAFPDNNPGICLKNLGTIADALDEYRVQSGGRYPASLQQLTTDRNGQRRIMSAIPTCPQTGCDTYSAGYRVSEDFRVYTLTSGCEKITVGVRREP